MKYKKCAVIVVLDQKNNKVLVCDRKGVTPAAWQFPQGGLDFQESFINAAKRELYEETGLSENDVEFIKNSDVYFYDFPKHVKSSYKGKETMWFLAKKIKEEVEIKVNEEFNSFKWDTPQNVYDNIVAFKKENYLLGLKSLGLL
jgi:putative (di)nucleoside polyphosphate hydrolase